MTSESNPETCRKRSVLPLSCAVHPTIIDLIKTYPKLKIPNDLLKYHIEPKVALNRNEVENWVPPPTPEVDTVPTQPISELDRFKMMCPGIHITKVRDTTVKEQPEIAKVSQPSAPNKRKLTESPMDMMPKKRKTSPERCKSSMVVSLTQKTASKKRRSQTPAPHIEKHVPKLKISLRRSEENRSEINAVVTSIPTILNESRNSDSDTTRHQPVVQHRGESPSEPLVNRRSTENSEEPPVVPASKGIFMESLSMQRLDETPVIRRSREPSVESPAIQRDTEPTLMPPRASEIADTTEKIAPRILNRRNVLESDSDGDDDRGFDTENLLDTFTEEIVMNCGVCNRMFGTLQQLKVHERFHQSCTICKMIFRSLDALLYHQREVCFKKVVDNPPNLELVRVDEQPEMSKYYIEAVTRAQSPAVSNKEDEISDVLCISDDDDVVVVGPSAQIPNETDSEDYRQSSSEFQFICRILEKYGNIVPRDTKSKATETKPNICIKYNSKSQIVLENMFSELQNYRVPVELVSKPNSFAYISFNKKVPEEENIYCWASEPVIGLNEKPSPILLNTQPTRDVPLTSQNILLGQPQTINNFNTKTTSITMTQPLINVPPSERIIAAVPVMTQSPINTMPAPVIATQNPINYIKTPFQLAQPVNGMVQSTIPNSQPILKAGIPYNSHITYGHSIPSTSNSNYFGIITTPTPLVLHQSGSSTSASNENFGLRVKSLSELS